MCLGRAMHNELRCACVFVRECAGVSHQFPVLFQAAKELRELTKSQIKAIRKENDNTRVRDPLHACPPPIQKWTHAGLSEEIMAELTKAGYHLPFAIQAQVRTQRSGRPRVRVDVL